MLGGVQFSANQEYDEQCPAARHISSFFHADLHLHLEGDEMLPIYRSTEFSNSISVNLRSTRFIWGYNP